MLRSFLAPIDLEKVLTPSTASWFDFKVVILQSLSVQHCCFLVAQRRSGKESNLGNGAIWYEGDLHGCSTSKDNLVFEKPYKNPTKYRTLFQIFKKDKRSTLATKGISMRGKCPPVYLKLKANSFQFSFARPIWGLQYHRCC